MSGSGLSNTMRGTRRIINAGMRNTKKHAYLAWNVRKQGGVCTQVGGKTIGANVAGMCVCVCGWSDESHKHTGHKIGDS